MSNKNKVKQNSTIAADSESVISLLGDNKDVSKPIGNKQKKTKSKTRPKSNKNKTEKRKTGDLGETITCTFLMKQGFSIVEQNYLKKYGEIDIIALKDEIYHFIEVKTVSCESFPDVNHETDGYRPEDNVHAWKLKKLSKTIQAYILDKKIFEYEWQFDVALVYLNTVKRVARVNLLEDIIL